METKKIAIILIVLAVAIIAVCIIITSIHNDDGSNGQYNYKVGYSDSFDTYVEGIPVPVYAKEGRTFAIAEMTVKNDSFSAGINTVKMEWKLTLDRMTYVMSAHSAEHPDYWAVTIEKGKTWAYTVVFEIDKNAVGKKDLSIDYSYIGDSAKPKLDYNKDLRLEGSVGSMIETVAAVQRLYVPAY